MINETRHVVILLAVFATFASQAQQVSSEDERSPLDQAVPVAEEGPDTLEPGAEADAELTLDERLSGEFQRYRRLVNEGAMDEADVSAKRIVEMVIRIHGPESLEAAKALNNLALVQHKNGQYDAAIQNFESAIGIIETREDRLNARLVNPLKGLGAAQLGNGRPDLATETFGRATHITHVNEGPHNIEQVEILESLAQSTLLVGDSKGARKIIDRIYVLNVRHFAGDELALVPSLMRRARWQHAAHYYNDERATYRRAIRIVEAKLGKNDPELILPLSKLGESFYFLDTTQTIPQQQGLVSTGEMYFKRAAKIAEQSPEVGWRDQARTKLSLADYYLYGESYNRARKLYLETWNFLSTDEERLAARATLLEQPVILKEGSLPKYVGGAKNGGASGGDLLQGAVRVDYTLSKRGRVRNIRTEAIPPQFTDMQRMVHREIRQRLFRPQIENAELRNSDNRVFEHTFFYQQADLDKAIAQQEAAEKR